MPRSCQRRSVFAAAHCSGQTRTSQREYTSSALSPQSNDAFSCVVRSTTAVNLRRSTSKMWTSCTPPTSNRTPPYSAARTSSVSDWRSPFSSTASKLQLRSELGARSTSMAAAASDKAAA
ncbi:hypothetical protein M885DRAFT_541345 [Pelagophyceae sp. CCMP2097]|nr:hypothetical protein M885DRAFT_541345 [Pelagophyceae sp. CCMP2097]